MKARVTAALVVGSLLMMSCVEEAVEWGEIAYRPSLLGDPDTRSAIMGANLAAVPGAAGSCMRSIKSVGDSADLFRVWWSARADSSVVLSVQRSTDRGATWLAPTVVDSADRGRRGCDRPAPGTAFDPESGFLYVVYFIEPPTGAGIFFAHSMDRAEMFHAPVPVVYGKRPVNASVTGRGDSVVVVFEDPNTTKSRVEYALSHTSGHIFERRGAVTPSEAVATAPWVALEGKRIRVWWKRGERVGYRSGIWK